MVKPQIMFAKDALYKEQFIRALGDMDGETLSNQFNLDNFITIKNDGK